MLFILILYIIINVILICKSFPLTGRGVIASPITKQQLVLISGCTGTGKSTFGMEVAISRGILKCISTDTIRQVQRTYDLRPAVHRSSFQGDGEPGENWKETCQVLQESIDNVVYDCLNRGISLVLEGVHIIPDKKLINDWISKGGVAVGCVLTIPDAEVHKKVIFRRGEQTMKGAEQQLQKFTRIRTIHDEMVRLGKLNNWLLIEQKPFLELSPMDLLNQELLTKAEIIPWTEGTSKKLLSSPIPVPPPSI